MELWYNVDHHAKLSLWLWNGQDGHRYHGNSKNAKKIKVFPSERNFTGMVTGMCWFTVWLRNFQNGRRYHGNCKNVKNFKKLQNLWNFQKNVNLQVNMHSLRNFQNGCRYPGNGGRVPSVIASNYKSSYVTRSTKSGDILLFLCFFFPIIIMAPSTELGWHIVIVRFFFSYYY